LGLQGLQVTLMDGDLISETNCVRQPFSRGEVGMHKSIVLASRLNQFWGLNWEAAPEYLTDKSKLNHDIVVGCVDHPLRSFPPPGGTAAEVRKER
jgi:hypothetical protein